MTGVSIKDKAGKSYVFHIIRALSLFMGNTYHSWMKPLSTGWTTQSFIKFAAYMD